MAPRWRKPFTRGNFHLTQNKQDYNVSSFIQRLKDNSISAAISEFFKVSTKTIKQVYHSIRSKTRLHVINFVVNDEDNTLVSLVDKGW